MELSGLHSCSDAAAGYLPQKRKRADFPNMTGERSHFMKIDGQRGVYYSERCEPNGSTLYLPVRGTVLANMHKYEQISFEQGYFCTGDETGGFQQRVQGQALHCWRYSKAERKLFIALSYFFTNTDVFQE
ncbi:glyoxylate reductase hydroxypyruvate reductase-like protein, partial [Clarias magur]